jgi:predicted RNA-binding Zn-ribbon protein involved in translation (DUF1610 family)
MGIKPMCDCDRVAQFRVTMTDVSGRVLGSMNLCQECGYRFADREGLRIGQPAIVPPDDIYGTNIREPEIEVRHSELERFSSESLFRSKCPKCHEGILPVGRDPKTLRLSRHDRCVVCGQAVRYTDKSICGSDLAD